MSEQEMLVNKMKCLHLEMLPECPPWRGNFHPSSFYNCSGKTRYSWWKLLWIIKIVFFLIEKELISMQCQPTNCFYHPLMLRVVCVCVCVSGGSHLLLFTVNSALEVCLWRQLGVEGEISPYEGSEPLWGRGPLTTPCLRAERGSGHSQSGPARETGPQVQDLPARWGSHAPRVAQKQQVFRPRGATSTGTVWPATLTQIRTEQVSNDGYESTAPQLVGGGLGLTFNLM